MIGSDVSAIIVLYHPNWDDLKKALERIENQVDKIILTDNSSGQLDASFFDTLSFAASSKIQYIFNGENLGVAKAQNLGIKSAFKLGYDFVIIFDQDSLAANDMVSDLKRDYYSLINRNIKVAAIGPQSINMQSQSPYKPRIRKHKPFFSDMPAMLEVTELISSGCLAHRRVFEDVGFMDELLFIDGVDHEWCWRARVKGYRCALTENAELQHMLGEGDRKFLFMTVSICSPFRVYYQYRNYIYLCSKSYVPLYWKFNNLIKYIIKLFYYPVFVKPHTIYLKNMLKGIKAGVKILKNQAA